MEQIPEARRAANAMSQVGNQVQTRGGTMRPQDVARAGALSGNQELTDLGTTASRVTDRPALKVNREGQLYFGGAAGLATFAGGWPAVVTALTAVGIGHGLASRTAQRALMGDTKAQQALLKLLNENPKALAMIDRLARTAANQSVQGE
jgi:hypothetical protein